LEGGFFVTTTAEGMDRESERGVVSRLLDAREYEREMEGE
jgi:hypothetical protein